MNCLLCSWATEPLQAFPRSVTSEGKVIAAASVLRLCPSCGHLQTSVDLDLGRYYADAYDAALTDDGHDEIVSTTDGRVVFRTDLDFEILERHLSSELARAPAIFEFGCGRGRILSRLHKKGHRRLAAYDVSELYRECAARFVGADAIHIGRRPAELTCDLAFSLFVLEHDVDPVDSLLYLAERLRPAGKLYLMLPSYRTNVADLACADHLNHYSPAMLSALIEASGMRVVALDDTSAIGAVVVVAERAGPSVPRERMQLGDPRRVASSRAAAAEFVEYLTRLRGLTRMLGEHPIVLYGAGFYGALVQSHLEAAGLQVTAVFDANPRKQGLSRLGSIVRSPDALTTGEWSGADVVMCVNPRIAAGVAERLAPHVRKVHGL